MNGIIWKLYTLLTADLLGGNIDGSTIDLEGNRRKQFSSKQNSISSKEILNTTWIHTYIIGHYNPSVRIIEPVSYSIYKHSFANLRSHSVVGFWHWSSTPRKLVCMLIAGIIATWSGNQYGVTLFSLPSQFNFFRQYCAVWDLPSLQTIVRQCGYVPSLEPPIQVVKVAEVAVV